MDVFAGYKTYAAALLLALVGIAEGVLGVDIPGVTVQDDWLLVLINSLGLTGIRAAIARGIVNGLT